MAGYLFIKGTFALLAAQGLCDAISTAPQVTIQNGTVTGSSNGVIESFKGIPFAQPPVGQLRLRPPQSINQTFGTIHAVGVPTACPQFLVQNLNTSLLPPNVAQLVDTVLAAGNGPSGEDCLTLNVQRPAGTSASSKLPVVVWIYGGAFEFGSTQMYDASSLLLKSIALQQPILYVAMNYRVAGFGFMPGVELQKEGSTNLGLRDQRLAIEWVAENIAAFGGDPDRVTLWGESAGSSSVFDQTIIYSGDNTYNGKPLFHAAIMDSGCTQPVNSVTSPKSLKTFESVVGAAGCSGSADVLACLRSLPYPQFLAAANSVPSFLSYQSLDEAYLAKPDPDNSFFPVSPEIAVQQGNYPKIPTIIGDQEDEGTLFSLEQFNLSTTDQLITYINSVFSDATRDQAAGLVNTYPNDPAAGSPFNTGELNEIYPQYKRLAAIYGDTLFTLQRRIYLSHITNTQPTWSYLASYLYGTPILGTFHATDVLELYFNIPLPYPVDTIATYYISFINSHDPNTIPNPAIGQKIWPMWDEAQRQLMHFNAQTNNLTTDTFREQSYQYLAKYQSVFRFG